MSEESVVTESTPESNTPSWFIDEQTPGNGERPDWLPTKYKSAAELGKSYKELESKLGGFTGAPEKYDFGDMEVDESQLLVQEITSVAKELNMSQDGLNKFLGRIVQATQTEDEMHLEDQLKSLGSEGETMMKQYSNFTKTHFKPEEAEVVKGWIKTADDLKAFNKLMVNTSMSSVPTNTQMAQSVSRDTIAELRSELTQNIGRFETDKAYNKNWSARMANAVAREKG